MSTLQPSVNRALVLHPGGTFTHSDRRIPTIESESGCSCPRGGHRPMWLRYSLLAAWKARSIRSHPAPQPRP
ncbi:hypothetical protein AnigIFM62618_009872 [Aspergillus niger]|nr:hypothetical protein AnigIFM62618_009872 [Aspergillus niger]